MTLGQQRIFAKLAVGIILVAGALRAGPAFAAQNAVVDSAEAKVYKGPNVRYEEMATLKKGTLLIVANLPIEGFYKTRLPDGKIGFISGDAIAIYPPGSAVPVRAVPAVEPSPSTTPRASPSPSTTPRASPSPSSDLDRLLEVPKPTPSTSADITDTMRLSQGASPESDVLPPPPVPPVEKPPPADTAPAVTYDPSMKKAREVAESSPPRSQLRGFGGMTFVSPSAAESALNATPGTMYAYGGEISLPISSTFDFLFRAEEITGTNSAGAASVVTESSVYSVGLGWVVTESERFKLRLDLFAGYAYRTRFAVTNGDRATGFRTDAFAEQVIFDLTLPLFKHLGLTFDAGYRLLNTGTAGISESNPLTTQVSSVLTQVDFNGPVVEAGLAFLF